MGIRAFLDRMFPPPPPSRMLERYLETGESRWIDELFDGWVYLDDQTYDRLMTIHEQHGGSGLYGGLLESKARDDLMQLATALRQAGK